MGCLIYGIVTLFIGAFICVGLGLEGDSAGGMFVVFLCVFGPIVGLIIMSFADEAEKNRIAEEKRLEQQRIENEKKRLKEAKQKEEHVKGLLTEISSNYSLNEYRIIKRDTISPKRGTYVGSMVLPQKNRDVSDCFATYYEEISRIDSRIEELQNKARFIMSCPGCSSNEDKLNYLQAKIPELTVFKDGAKQLHSECYRKKIHITNFDSIPLTKLRNAIVALENSEKLISLSENPPEIFFQCVKPKELEYFHSSVTPIVLNFDRISAFCYPKIILLFEGMYFLAGINPDELKIAVSQKEETARYYFNQNDYKDNRFLGNDSFVVKKGFERTTWLHTCKDGSPDLRYSYNPATHFRDDVVRYGIVRFYIGKYCAEFAFSSYQAYEALITAQNSYCINNTIPKDPLPKLLDLLDCLGCNSDAVQEMRSQQLIYKEKDLPVCRIIGSQTS